MSKTYEKLIKILTETLGLIIMDEEDFAINEYIYNSIIFIEFIVAIEDEFKVELSDDFLNYDLLSSARGFAEKIDSYLESINKGTL